MTAQTLRPTAAVICLLALTFGAPAHARIRVETTRSPGFELASYETYAFADPERAPIDLLEPGGELDRLYKEVVGARLAELGLRPAAPGETPGLLVRWVAYAEDVLTSDASWDQYEHWAAPVDPVGLSGTRGVVIVDLVDTGAGGEVVWSGRARSSAGTPEQLVKKVRKMLEKLTAALR